MRRLTVFLLASALGAVTLAPALAQITVSTKSAPYRAPRTADGKPDLQGSWTNATLTPMDRPGVYGERRDLTPQEAAKMEGANNAMLAERSLPTKADAKVEDLPCDPANCGYNQGWIDPGETVMRVAGVPRTSFITFPANGRPPAMSATAQARAAEARRLATGFNGARPGERLTFSDRSAGFSGQNDNPETRTPGERCLVFGNVAGPVMSPTLYNNNYEFIQTKDHLAIVVEMIHDVRIVRIGEKHRTDGVKTFAGDSIGWWEGDTLVTETTGFNQLQNFRGSSDNLKVTEKFTRVAPDRVLYQFKVEDPDTWAQPWGGEYEFGKAKGHVYEYACNEGNYGLQNILAGARAEEQDAAAKTPARAVAR